MRSAACVLVVHCVDTEGPIGGGVRRRPDGSAEFIDNWGGIKASLRRMTNKRFRQEHADSYGNPYLFNWFIMDFTGFKTNPKQRVAAYHDTYDNIKSLQTTLDGFYWHYHHPPRSGQGDQWSDDWGSSGEYSKILLHRLVEREDFPEAFRAGGTIEDNKCSHWLEDNILVDFSNRATKNSRRTNNIFDFNWHGAPTSWGFYHPDVKNFLKPGKMRRYIVRSVDLWSRLHKLSTQDVKEAFTSAQREQQPVILSYFSHDHRDMNDETRYAIYLIRQMSRELSVPWQWCCALQAVQIADKIEPALIKVSLGMNRKLRLLTISFDHSIYQPMPWVGGQNRDKSLQWLEVKKIGQDIFQVSIPHDVLKIVIGGTSVSGNKFVKSLKFDG